MPARLITIPFSHYCEKARWALVLCGVAYREEGHHPLFHYTATFRAGAKRRVPALIDGKTVVLRRRPDLRVARDVARSAEPGADPSTPNTDRVSSTSRA